MGMDEASGQVLPAIPRKFLLPEEVCCPTGVSCPQQASCPFKKILARGSSCPTGALFAPSGVILTPSILPRPPSHEGGAWPGQGVAGGGVARRGRRRRGGAGGGRQRRRRRLPATSALGECGRGRAHAAPGDAQLSAGPGRGCSASVLHPPPGGAARGSSPRFAAPRDALHPPWGWAGRASLPVVTPGGVGLGMLCPAVTGGDALPPRAVRETVLRLGELCPTPMPLGGGL